MSVLMSLTKRAGGYWHYDFVFRGRRFQGSTNVKNINLARQVEAKIRSDAALEFRGIAPPKESPLFTDFMENQFLEDVRKHAKAKRTPVFYADRTKRLLEYQGWASARVSDIDEEAIERYKTYRLRMVQVSTVNRELATLRKALGLAYEWKLIPRRPRVRQLPGEKGRDFIVSVELEAAYLAAAEYPLREAAILMLELGLRPDECVSLRKADVTDHGVSVVAGKTANARRLLPQTSRTREVFALLRALWPESDYLFPGRKKGTHLKRGSIGRLHNALRAKLAAVAGDTLRTDSGQIVQSKGMPAHANEFVIYSFRHTFGTMLAESGANPFQIMKLMGHANIQVSQKYVHPRADDLMLCMKRKELMDLILRGEVHVEETPEKSKTP